MRETGKFADGWLLFNKLSILWRLKTLFAKIFAKMGLYVQSLENLPADAHREYYIYLLDYGWSEPLGETLMKNYERMAEMAEKNNAVVIRSRNRVHFEDQVLSWHSINGEEAKDILPAVLITNRNPHHFRESYSFASHERTDGDLKLILIPLRKLCSITTDEAALIDRLFADILAKKKLSEFRIEKQIKKGGRALADSLILAPDKSNKGLTMEQVINFLQGSSENSVIRPGTDGIEKTVLPIHFEDRSGTEFERLVFAYVLRQRDWDSIEWLGQTGGDDGRDIWGVSQQQTYCFQCANYRQLTFKKITDDIDKLVNEKMIPDHYTVVCGGRVTATLRTKIRSYAEQSGISAIEIWSGVEFEEKLRQNAPELIRRFVEGESFPDGPAQLIQVEKLHNAKNDEDILDLLIECFDRPAFTTRFRNESNIPDFEKAITDTVEVLNTGIHRLRDGTLIRRIPSRHNLKAQFLKKELASITQLVIQLRETFNRLKKENEIRPCGCDNNDCSIWMLSDKACGEMDNIRQQIFRVLKAIRPSFSLHLH